jgi:hypothetical protein
MTTTIQTYLQTQGISWAESLPIRPEALTSRPPIGTPFEGIVVYQIGRIALPVTPRKHLFAHGDREQPVKELHHMLLASSQVEHVSWSTMGRAPR